MAEWLRRWTRNPLGSSRTGSNPVGDAYFFFSKWLTVILKQIAITPPHPPQKKRLKKRQSKSQPTTQTPLPWNQRGGQQVYRQFSDKQTNSLGETIKLSLVRGTSPVPNRPSRLRGGRKAT